MQLLTYPQFEFACKTIARNIKTWNIKNIYGIPRGGLIPAVYLSHLTNLPLTQTYGEHTLVVDDIADSGKTLKHYQTSGCKTATIFYRKESITKPDIWIYEKEKDWILFPWETKESTGEIKCK